MPGVLWAETGDSALSSSPPFTGEAGFFSMKNGVLTAFSTKTEYHHSFIPSHSRSTKHFL